MRVLKARYRTRQAFLEAFDEGLPYGGLFCATTQALEQDDEVVVELFFPELPNKMMLRGTVVSWRPALPRLRVRAGAVVAFAKEEELKKNFILEVAAGGRQDAVKRKHARIPVERQTRWRRNGTTESEKATLREISIGGAQLVTKQSLQIEEEVVLEVTMPGGAQPVTISAAVTYRTPSGYGLRFAFRDGGGSRRLREMIRRLIDTD